MIVDHWPTCGRKRLSVCLFVCLHFTVWCVLLKKKYNKNLLGSRDHTNVKDRANVGLTQNCTEIVLLALIFEQCCLAFADKCRIVVVL